MELAKGLLQATVVVLWTGYVISQIVSAAGGAGDGRPDPTGGLDLIVNHIESLPIESLVLPTAVMIAGVLGLEIVFVAIRRFGQP